MIIRQWRTKSSAFLGDNFFLRNDRF